MEEEESGLESNICILRSDTTTFPSGTHSHPRRAEAHCDLGGGIYLLILLVAFEGFFGKFGMLLLIIAKLKICFGKLKIH